MKQIFADYMHTAVNPLAGEEHLKEVIQQLQLMGEVGDDDEDDDGDGVGVLLSSQTFFFYNYLPHKDISNHHDHQVVYLKCDAGDDLIILDPKWLCATLCGLVLSPEFR